MRSGHLLAAALILAAGSVNAAESEHSARSCASALYVTDSNNPPVCIGDLLNYDQAFVARFIGNPPNLYAIAVQKFAGFNVDLNLVWTTTDCTGQPYILVSQLLAPLAQFDGAGNFYAAAQPFQVMTFKSSSNRYPPTQVSCVQQTIPSVMAGAAEKVDTTLAGSIVLPLELHLR